MRKRRMTRASEGKRGGHNVVDHLDGEDEYGRYDMDSTAASIFVVILVELTNTVFAVLSTMTMKTGALGEFIL